eukprot:PITA_06932
MALLSSAPLVSISRPLVFTSTFELKAMHRTIANLGMGRHRKSATPSLTMSSTTSVSNEDVVRRRADGYHYNQWGDDLIDSLATSYEAPSYRERANKLIGEVRDIFNSMAVENGELMSPLNDLYQRLWMVDNVERSFWNGKGIGRGRECAVADLNSTALGLRTLRLHGYTVPSDVLEHFKDHNGQFTCSAIQTEGEIGSVLNLFRASLIAFPGENVMEEAEIFSTKYLNDALQKIVSSSLSQEIEYVLEYGWHTNLPRLEARMYMEVFPQDTIYE